MVNYHSHTKRCHHANGEDEMYIKAAIANGYDGIGFSDHVMFPFVKANNVRGGKDELLDYYESINNLKEKYKGQIEIYLGFECEWDDRFYSYYKDLLDSKKVDYLIFGNHLNYFKRNFDEAWHKSFRRSYILDFYYKKAVKALNSGLFKIFAHPDLFMGFMSWNKKVEEVSRKLCLLAKENNIALEINCGALNSDMKWHIKKEYRYKYPYDKFWKIAKEVGNTIVIGLDAHDPSDYENVGRNRALEFANLLGLEITDRLDIESRR